MRRIAIATLIAAAGLVVGTGQHAAAATDAQLSLGQMTCDTDQAVLVVNINGGQGETFDVELDGDPLIDNIVGNSGTTRNVTDGIHTITLLDDQGGTVQSALIGATCGDPAIDVFDICRNGVGGLNVIAVPGSLGGQFDLYLDGDIFESGLGDSTWGHELEGIPNGDYLVGVKNSTNPGEFLYEENVTVECGTVEPTVVTVDARCEPAGIGVEIDSFTYGERFTLILDGVEQYTNLFAKDYEVSATSGAHHFVVENQLGDVLYDDTVLVACDGPLVAAKVECAAGTGELFIKIADDAKFVYDVSVDGQPLAAWQNVTDTDELWASLGDYASGEHTVFVEWFHEELGDDSEELMVEVDCTDDGSGTPLPDSGSNTTPIMLLAGGLMAAGALLLAARRIRHA